MRGRRPLAILVLLCLVPACRHPAAPPPPPDARRPVIQSQAELAMQAQAEGSPAAASPAESSDPVLSLAPAPPVRPAGLVPLQPQPGAIEPGLLLVNDTTLTMAEILYPLRQRIHELRASQTPAGFVEALQRLLRLRIQQEVGVVLIYKQATAALSDAQRKVIDEAVAREVQGRITDEFGGSAARFDQHLQQNGLTREQYRTSLERELVARQYTREKFASQVFVPRHELLAWFRRNESKFSTGETRELGLIEAPFEAFLPAGTSWSAASAAQRAQSRVEAARHIRAAQAALAGRPFAEVAREYSRGPHAVQGGSWGAIGRPLQPPYDALSTRIFSMSEGQATEPVETGQGWYIVRCGQVTPARTARFADVQDQIRQDLLEAKFERLSAQYMLGLAEKATVSALEPFIRACLRHALGADATALLSPAADLPARAGRR